MGVASVRRAHGAGRFSIVPWLLGAFWLVAFALGLYGLGQRLLTGHELTNYGSYVPWGLWVALYVYFMGLSAGSFLIAALGYLAGIRSLERVSRLALLSALAAVAAGLLAIWLDLGHPMRFWKLYASAQPTSVMSWMVWLYTLYSGLLVAMLWLAVRRDLALGRQGFLARASSQDQRALRVLAGLGVVLVVAFSGGSGALFGVVGARPFWNSPLYPILFLASALTSGAALLTFVAAVFDRRESRESSRALSYLGGLTLAMLLVYLLMEWAEISINLYAAIPAEADAYRAFLFGPYWWVFWGVHLAVGSIIPIVLLAWRRGSRAVAGLAGLLVAVSFVAVRLNIILPGQTIPELAGLASAYTDPRLTFSYAPSSMEWLVGLLVASVAVAVFYVGYRLLPVTATASEEA